MNNKINEIKKHLLEGYSVTLAKQCKQEYIVYHFYLDYDNKDIIKKYGKFHYRNSKGDLKKWKITRTEIHVHKFLNEIVYDLLNRGYTLDPMGYEFDNE